MAAFGGDVFFPAVTIGTSPVFRLIDVTLCALVLVFAALPMAVIAGAIWLNDRGPVIFRQPRVGQGGRVFTVLKFRSMLVDTSGIGKGHVDQAASLEDKAAARARFKTTSRNDPRITAVGRVIRKTHLDELPQLFNVLQGDMSLVGVRPDTPAQEADYDPAFWVERHRFRPGITGLAQVTMGSDGTLADRCRYETEWNRNRSVGLYFTILWKTAFKVLKRSSF